VECASSSIRTHPIRVPAMGFFRFFSYRHPILNFIFQDPNDKLKGFLRRAVILNVLTLTFTFTIINDQLLFHGKENTKSDLQTLANDHVATHHLIVTVAYTCGIFVIEWLNEFIYGMTTWSCMQTPCCAYFRWTILSNALWLFVLNVALYVALLREKSDLFLGWLFSYGLYALAIAPLWIIISYTCLGGKQKEKLLERERADGALEPLTESERQRNRNEVTYA